MFSVTVFIKIEVQLSLYGFSSFFSSAWLSYSSSTPGLSPPLLHKNHISNSPCHLHTPLNHSDIHYTSLTLLGIYLQILEQEDLLGSSSTFVVQI